MGYTKHENGDLKIIPKEAFVKKIIENVEKVIPAVEEELSIEEIEEIEERLKEPQ